MTNRNIPIYVISLASDTERRQQLQEKFPESYNFFQFIEALDLRGKKKSEISHLYIESPYNKRKPLTPTEVACSLSHETAWATFIKTKLPWCIILEDDVYGHDDDIRETVNIIRKLEGSGFFLLGGQQGMKNSKYILGTRQDKHWIIDRRSLMFCTRACSYAISRETAIELISQNKKYLDRSDNWETRLRKIPNLYYINKIKHPENLNGSHLEREREKSFGTSAAANIYRDGATRLIKVNLRKMQIIFLALFSKKELIIGRKK